MAKGKGDAKTKNQKEKTTSFRRLWLLRSKPRYDNQLSVLFVLFPVVVDSEVAVVQIKVPDE